MPTGKIAEDYAQVYIYRTVKPFLRTLADGLGLNQTATVSLLILLALQNLDVFKAILKEIDKDATVKIRLNYTIEDRKEV